MSFILEALNKAERDRGSQTGHAITAPHPIENNPRRQWLLVFLISIAGSALVFGLYLALQNSGFFSQEQKDAITAAPAAILPQKPTKAGAEMTAAIDKKTLEVRPTAPVNNANTEASRLHNMVGEPTQAAAIHTADKLTTTEKKDTTAAAKLTEDKVAYQPETKESALSSGHNDIPLIHNLPESIRTQLPALELNVHVFSDNPSKRFVYINSIRYSEGARIGDGIILEEIISNGVILSYRGTFFRLVIKT